MGLSKKVLFYKTAKGECPYKDFLGEVKKHGVKTKRIESSVKMLSEKGLELAAIDLVAPIEGKLWELKPDPFRVFFYEGNQGFVLLNGYRKQKRRTPAKHLKRARSLCQEALAEMEGGQNAVSRGNH